jgi:hypothetical protein
MAVMLGVAACIIIGVVLAGYLLGRWDTFGYPDTLWLYVAMGFAVAAPAVGRVSRGPLDPDVWALLAVVVPTGLFVAEAIFGPSCPIGADCSTIGARGSLGLLLSLVVVALLAAISWGLARWMYSAAMKRRPASGRVNGRITAIAMLTLLLFPGSVVAAAVIGTDVLMRDTPKLASAAAEQVEEECFDFAASPDLVARSAPEGYNTGWRTFAVHNVDEDRKGIQNDPEPADDTSKDTATGADKDKHKDKDKDARKAPAKPTFEPLPDDWATLGYVHPYEATVSFNEAGEPVHVTCRKVASGQAVQDDLVTEEPDSNPMSPKTTGATFLPRFFTQGVAGPTEEGKKKAKEEAAARKRAAASKAAADTADPNADSKAGSKAGSDDSDAR